MRIILKPLFEILTGDVVVRNNVLVNYGILKIYEVGKGWGSDSRFNDFVDGTPIIANMDQVRRFIQKYLSY